MKTEWTLCTIGNSFRSALWIFYTCKYVVVLPIYKLVSMEKVDYDPF